jgi:tripartite-type tricarboxylate transporter receptor subunit TctC
MNFAWRQFDRLGAAVVAVTILTLSGHGAWSQATRTIKVVVPTAPGGSLDFVARLLSEQIGRAQGQTMVVEDRPGAGNLIGTDAVARAAPDGNTLLFNANAFVIDPHMRKVNYDPLTSFEPICQLVNTPTVLVVNNASPYHTLIGHFREHPKSPARDLGGWLRTQSVSRRSARSNSRYLGNNWEFFKNEGNSMQPRARSAGNFSDLGHNSTIQ